MKNLAKGKLALSTGNPEILLDRLTDQFQKLDNKQAVAEKEQLFLDLCFENLYSNFWPANCETVGKKYFRDLLVQGTKPDSTEIIRLLWRSHDIDCRDQKDAIENLFKQDHNKIFNVVIPAIQEDITGGKVGPIAGNYFIRIITDFFCDNIDDSYLDIAGVKTFSEYIQWFNWFGIDSTEAKDNASVVEAKDHFFNLVKIYISDPGLRVIDLNRFCIWYDLVVDKMIEKRLCETIIGEHKPNLGLAVLSQEISDNLVEIMQTFATTHASKSEREYVNKITAKEELPDRFASYSSSVAKQFVGTFNQLRADNLKDLDSNLRMIFYKNIALYL